MWQSFPPSSGIRPWLFGFLLTVLCLPALNHALGIIESGALQGDVRLAPDTSFTVESWLRGSYQQQKESYLNDNTGFRSDLVRFNNQFDYTFFTELHANNIVEGKEKYLFEASYIHSLYGRDYVGDSTISSQVRKLRFIQDTLQKAGKKLLIAFAPSKARFYPEYIPDNLKPEKPVGKTNYMELKERCTVAGIPIIDLNEWYRAQKEKHPNRLFAKDGIHWTYYGSDLAADTFNRRLEQMLGMDLPDMNIIRTDCDQPARGTDRDIASGLNLIWPSPPEKLCYHTLDFSADGDHKQRPNIIFISDSFFWIWMYENIPQNYYHHWQAWFYFQQAWGKLHNDQDANGISLSEMDWMKEIASTDAVVILATEINLNNIGSGFIGAAYEKLQPAGK